MKPLLELQNVSYAYHSKTGETFALSDISFQVNKGEFIAVVGPSGCGKTTLLSLISGLLRPESGSVLFEGQKDASFQEKIGYMLQRDHLFEWRTIYQNVTLGLEIQHKINDDSKARIDKMLMDYGLYKFRNAKPSEHREKKTALLVTHDLSEAVSMADRIIVLTKRPARISTILEITFEEGRPGPFARRNTPEFKEYFNVLWKELNSHE